MIAIKKAFLLAASLLIVAIAAWGVPVAEGDVREPLQGEISLTISAVQDTVVAGSPANVKIIAANISPAEIYLAFPDVYHKIGTTYTVDIRDAQGNLPPDTSLGRVMKYNRDGSVNDSAVTLLTKSLGLSLKPGETFADTIDVGATYDLSQPGQYRVQVERMGSNGQIQAKSNIITINVIPAQNGAQAVASTSAPPFSLTISMLPSDSVSRGTQVALKVTTQNTSDHTIALWADTADNRQGNSTYQISIHAADGSVPADTPMGHQQKARTGVPRGAGYSMTSAATKGQRFALKPGESWTDTVMLNELYDLNKPGQYTIQVRRFDPATGTMVTSNDITLAIAP